MKLGLIVRADDSGLGVQTYELYRHLKPAKTLVIDSTPFNDRPQHLERYPDAWLVNRGFLSDQTCAQFLDGLDVVFTVEIPYNYDLFRQAKERGIATILQYNYEFLDYLQTPDLALPTLFAGPTSWHFNDIPFANKKIIPMPVARDVLLWRKIDQAKKFVHLIGRPAVNDRNGTDTLLEALAYIKKEVEIVFKTQDSPYAAEINAKINHSYQHGTIPANVKAHVEVTDHADYAQNYKDGDVLVLPRKFGGLCLPLHEALSTGMPVIMTDLNPQNELLPKEWLVNAAIEGELMTRTMLNVYAAGVRLLADKIDWFAGISPRKMYEQNMMAGALAHKLSWDELSSEYQALLEVACQMQKQSA